MVDDTGFEEGDGGEGEGGTSGSGGTYGKGGTGVAGTYADGGAYPSGGYAGVYGGKGGTSYAGFGATGGSVNPGGYGGYAGTVYPGGYAGNVYPGGKSGVGGSVYPGGYGGFAGSVYPGGKGGVGGSFAGGAGVGGVGGKAAYADVVAACSSFCSNVPPVCVEGTTWEGCNSQCVNSGVSEPNCSSAFADYVNCVGKMVQPNAMCSVDDSGVCYGPGCLDEALARCSGESLRYIDCLNGAPQCGGSAISSTGDTCSMTSFCDRTYRTDCYYSYTPEAYWNCYCYVDDFYYGSTTVASSGRDVCSVGYDYCGFPR
jgi:hypothetical protein